MTRERLAQIIKSAWEASRDVPFPLYDIEAEEMADAILAEMPAGKWNEAIEAAAQMLDDSAQEFNKIRDPGMANHDRATAKRIRALRRPDAAPAWPAPSVEDARRAVAMECECGCLIDNEDKVTCLNADCDCMKSARAVLALCAKERP